PSLTCHHHLVAGTNVPPALPERVARRIANDRKVRTGCDCRSGAEPHGPCVVDHSASQPATRFAHGEVPHRRFAAIAVCLCVDRSPRSLRSPCPALRRLGSRETEVRILLGRCCQGSWIQQANARAPHACCTGKIPTFLFPEPACGTCSPFAEDRQRQCR